MPTKKVNSAQLLPSTAALRWNANYYLYLLKQHKKIDKFTHLVTDWNSTHPKQYMAEKTLEETIKGKHLSTRIALRNLCEFLEIPKANMLYFNDFPKQAVEYEHHLVTEIIHQLYDFGAQHIYEHHGETINTFTCAANQFGMTNVEFEKIQLVYSLFGIGCKQDDRVRYLYTEFTKIEYVNPFALEYGKKEKATAFYLFTEALAQEWQVLLNQFDKPLLIESNCRLSVYDDWNRNISCNAAKRELEARAIHNIYTLICNVHINARALEQLQEIAKQYNGTIQGLFSDDPLEDLFISMNKKMAKQKF